jgi:hypothetical protein
MIQGGPLPPASQTETNLAAAVVNPFVTCSQFAVLLRGIPAGERFCMRNTWTEYACNTSLDGWRRLAAYQIIVERCISYPRELQSFALEAIRAIGVPQENVIDMTPAHNLPFSRKAKQKIRMAILPIPMPAGRAAIYFAVDELNHYVEQAAVYPAIDNLAREGRY